MNIRWIEHQEIDKEKWNSCIAKASNATIFANYDFLSIANPFSALVYGDYEVVMPLPSRKKYGISYIFHPFFICRLGIFAQNKNGNEFFLPFLNKIPSKIKKVELCFEGDFQGEQLQFLHSNLLDLNLEYSNIYKNYSSNTKRNLKSSKTHNLIYKNGGDIGEITALFAENMGKNKHVPFTKSDYKKLEELALFAQQNNELEIATVVNNHNEIVAGGLFLKDNNRHWFWFSGRNEQHSEGKPMFFLIDEWIKKHANTPTYLDFNGSQNSNIDRFYKSFGAIEYPYIFLQISNSTIINTIQRWVKR